MADCAENLATATSDNEEKSLKDEHTSPNVEKDACLPPPPETCTNIQNRTVEPAGSAELYPHVSVITPLNEDDRNCEEITSDNKDYCNESYENCDDIDSRDPAEMCESTLEEISGNEPWIIVDSVEDDSESFENSSECRDQSVHNESFQASKSDKEENENLSCPRESSPCLITISEVRQNEPWLSDDSGSNIGKNGLPKEEFILSETTCKTIQEEEEPEEPVCSSEATAEFKTDSAEGCLVNPVNCVNENENKNIVQSSPVTETEINNENVLSEDGNENNQTETLTDEKCNQDDLKQSHEEPMDISEIKETCKESVEMSDAKQILEELEISNVKQSGDESVEAESIERNCEESVEESDAKQNCKESVDISSEKQSCEELMEVSSVEQNFNEEPMEVENTRPENDSDSVETKENKSENAECGQKVDKEVVSECEEEKINSIESSNEDCTLEKSKDSSSDKKISETAENKNHSKEKVSQEINFEEKDSSAINEEEKKKESEAEIKGYITDTMNELLGLFGYDNVDESMKDNLKLEKISSSISGKKTPELSDQASSKSVEPVKKDSSSRVCTECHATKKLKYQVLFQGKTRFLCSDTCFQVFRSKQKLTPTSSSSNLTSNHEMCAQCKKEIKNGQGYFPTGENKPLCSEDCMQKYQQIHGPKQVCSQCKNNIEGRTKCLTWETMEFCNEECLGKYQTFLGSHCTCCQAAVQRSSLGKYCVRFGSDIRQFCSGRCLEEFKKGLKVCSFCQKDLSSGQEGFLAPVGDKGYFKDFCSQQCMERYEMMNNASATPPTQKCSVCCKTAPIKVQVRYEGKSHALCSEPCIAAFRYANKINTTICDTCHKFFDSKNSQPFTLQFEGTSKRFCAKSCMNLFVLSHRKIVPCTWCKVKKYNFDMIERVDSNNHVQLFCSLNCLSLFRVSLNATSSRSIRCDHCQQSLPAQYHLTMSDASIRNFCSYQCVIHFQNQFTHVPTLTTATPSVRQNAANSSGKMTTPQTPTPIISSVMSLAPSSSASASTSSTSSKQSSQQTQKSVQITVPPKTRSASQSQAQSQPPPLTVISTKPNSVTTQSTVTTTASGSQIIREVIVRPPAPKLLKNKALLCKPIMQTKGISCKPHPCHKSIQTDDVVLDKPEIQPIEVDEKKKDEDDNTQPSGKPIIIPVPLPIFVPAPLHMFNRPVPTPMPFPLPIPVPVFIPTTKTSSSEILKHIKEIQEKIPSNPYEADLLMMAEMVAADGQKTPKEGSPVKKSVGDQLESFNSIDTKDANESFEMKESPMDQENAIVSSGLEQETSGQDELSSPEKSESRARLRNTKRTKSRGGRGRGRKKTRLDGDFSASDTAMEDSVSTQLSTVNESLDEPEHCLKYTFGVNAWKHWVLEKNSQLEKGSQSLRKLKLFKTDILQLSPDELNYSLCLFVKEVRKPQGDEYAPDSIYYLCLGIQQYLFENNRIDNIFTDPYYEKFTECLNDVLQKYDSVNNEVHFISRIEEEILWEAKQLGAHSPHVLLNTLMYFNTKYFFLKTIEDHMQLSFCHIMKHWKKSSVKGSTVRTVLLRYYPPISKETAKKQQRREEQPIFEQLENVDNPLRCPVKLYEFYMSKCPESVKTRNDVFYLYPERSCVPDSPVWYSTQPLGRESVSKMLQRIRMVREIHEIDDDQKG